MNIVDVIIVLLLISGAILGFKRGAIRTGVQLIGMIIAIVLAFLLKNSVSNLLLNVMPFFEFGGIFKGAAVLNILLYESVAFFLILAILFTAVSFLSFVANVIEKALSFTIVLGIPSKIIGIFIGFVEMYVYVFAIIYILSLPMMVFNETVRDSKLANKVLTSTPILSKAVEKPVNAMMDVYDLAKKYDKQNDEAFNKEALDLLLKYDITKPSTVDKLIKKGKLKVTGSDEVLNKYREG